MRSGFSRKVTASGVIWVHGRAFYVSRRLAGHRIPIQIVDGRLIIEVAVPLRKVYRVGRPDEALPPLRQTRGHGFNEAAG